MRFDGLANYVNKNAYWTLYVGNFSSPTKYTSTIPIPESSKMMFIIAAGGGQRGGNGHSAAASNTRGGGAGGRPGELVVLALPTLFVSTPSLLLNIAGQDTGGSCIVACGSEASPLFSTHTILIASGGGSAAANGTGSAGGAASTGRGSTPLSNMEKMGRSGLISETSSFPGGAGAGGAHTGAVGGDAYAEGFLCGGGGGAGVGTDNVGFAGGNVLGTRELTGAEYLPGSSGGAADGGRGINGRMSSQFVGCSVGAYGRLGGIGGSGGGSNGTAAGGNGGDGAPGCGGGGGGGGTTGGTGGAGGPGFILVGFW
jgi:hypothetical protein